MDRAERHPALRAARRLLARGVGIVAVGDLTKVTRALLGRAPDRIGLPAIHELEHRVVRHHRPTSKRMRSVKHTSELQSPMRISYAVCCLKKKKTLHMNIKKQYT